MAGISCFCHTNPKNHSDVFKFSSFRFNSHLSLQTIHGIRCCSGTPDNYNKTKTKTATKTPQLLKLAVSVVTQLLRLFSSSNKDRLDKVSFRQSDDEVSVKGVDDVIKMLKSDYDNAYFVTGIFTAAIYTEDCIFEDPTIRFRGKELYSRNLKLLVPFFERASIGLQKIEKKTWQEKMGRVFEFSWTVMVLPRFRRSAGNLLDVLSSLDFPEHQGALRHIIHHVAFRCSSVIYTVKGVNSKTNFVLATWKLRTYLKLPWRPLISIDGSTVYELDDDFKIVRHAESWNVSALEAIGQIFTPSFGRPGD